MFWVLGWAVLVVVAGVFLGLVIRSVWHRAVELFDELDDAARRLEVAAAELPETPPWVPEALAVFATDRPAVLRVRSRRRTRSRWRSRRRPA